MQMLLIIYRQSLEPDLHDLLKSLDVKSFTVTPEVLGSGESGVVFNSFEWPGSNSMILAAMEEEQAKTVVDRLRAFREELMRRQRGAKIPLRVFVLPCEQEL